MTIREHFVQRAQDRVRHSIQEIYIYVYICYIYMYLCIYVYVRFLNENQLKIRNCIWAADAAAFAGEKDKHNK